MLLPVSIAVSSALIDLGRPTNKGMTMCGNTTTSRRGNNGSCTIFDSCSVEVDMWFHLNSRYRNIVGARPREFKQRRRTRYSVRRAGPEHEEIIPNPLPSVDLNR